MTIDDEILRSRKLVEKFWPTIAQHCPDRRLRGSFLHPAEGLQGHRALDLDRRYHLDSWAVAGGAWTPLSTRFQDARFAEHNTITLRHTEVRHLISMGADPGQLGATLHVQMYGTDEALELVVIAELGPIIRYLVELDGRLWWRHAYDGTPFIALTCGTLAGLEALVWKCHPDRPEQMELFE